MARKIENTVVPRNPVARSPLLKKGGAHIQSKTGQRQQLRNSVKNQASSWREELLEEKSDRGSSGNS